ncbi:MAG: hypothetical protein J0L55_02620 [Caulobacterales bacterium]|nr:hypothetical protein [Caulobacterales bacterium]MCA0372744.1 hypothetical protein [Pseudomonadota bacterium]
MRMNFKLAASIPLLLITSSCASITLAPAGSYKNEQEVTLDRDWSDLSPVTYNNKNVKTLTIDGPLLNLVYISQGLTEKDPLFIGPEGDNKNHIAPRPKENMSLTEQMEFVANSVSELGFLKVEYASPKPVTVSDTKGVRFEIITKTKEGLDTKGLAQAVSKNGKNYYIVYIAPKIHYFNANKNNVIAIMDSQKLP